MATVHLEGVKKRYGATQVVHGVDVHITDGEFLVMVGPSGCGKSTLLRMVAGLEPLSEGTIRIGGQVVNGLEPKDRNVAMVFQNYALYPHMSVYDNMAYGLKVRKQSPEAIRASVEKAAALLGLTEYLHRKPRQLSGGQRQRVAMGRAIVRNPSVFLLDEPLSNLDAKLRNQMRVELKRLHQRLANTFIYVTHDQVEAMTLGQRIMVMQGGRVEQVGTPAQIYDTPASRFVADFIGFPSMNMFEGKLDGHAKTLHFAGQQLPVYGDVPGAATGVLVGIRPEHLRSAHDARGHPCALPVVVDLMEPLGGETIVHCTVPATGERDILFTMRTGTPMAENEKTSVVFRPTRLHVFDAAATRRIPGLRFEP